MAERPRIRVISLGGTIAMTPGANGVMPTLEARHLIDAIPDFAAVAQLSTEALRQTASSNLGLADVVALRDRVELSRSEGCVGSVITQGTDTLAETAFITDVLLDCKGTVVFTGAMRNAGAASADGQANVLDAVRVAASPRALGLGVLVVMNGEIHGARFVRKLHTSALNAFVSDPIGPLGTVSEGQVRVWATSRSHVPPVIFNPGAADSAVERTIGRHAERVPGAYVGLYSTFGGDDGRLLIDLLSRSDIRGLVIETLGAGHVPEKLVPMLTNLARKLPVVYTSRVAMGELFTSTYGYPGGEVDLLARGLICGGIQSTLKARALLELLLAAGYDRTGIEKYFQLVRS